VRRFKKSMNIHFSMPAPLNILITFIIVTLAWVFFRANSIEDANYILSHLHKGILQDFSLIIENLRTGNGIINNTSLAKWTSHRNDYIWSASVILLLILIEYANSRKNLFSMINGFHVSIRYAIYLGIIFSILFFQKSGQQFIYFQF